MRPVANSRGGMYSLLEDIEVKAKLSTLARRLEELEMQNQHEVRAVAEAPVPNQPCFICQSTGTKESTPNYSFSKRYGG